MSIFSDVLKEYIETKNVRILPLTKYCGLERTAIYKFLNGKREPTSPELVEKMAQFMRLTPSETQKLQDAWKITRIGEEIYYTQKAIENFILRFPAPQPERAFLFF